MGSTYADDPLTQRHYRHASHAAVLAEHPAFAWDAAADPDASALAQAQARWGFDHGATSIGELAARYDPEVLVLATPPTAYRKAVESCPNLKAVLCEKPMGHTSAEARALLDICASRGILLQVNYWRRGDSSYRRLAAGELAALVGEPQIINGLYGNGLANNGSHLVDFCRMFFGKVVGVRVLGSVLRSGELALADDFDVACVIYFENGTEATLRPIDFKNYREIGLDIWGSKCRLEILNEGLTTRATPCHPHRALSGSREICANSPVSLPSTVGDALYRIYDNLAAALNNREALVSPGDSAMQTACVIETIRTAAFAGDDGLHSPDYTR